MLRERRGARAAWQTKPVQSFDQQSWWWWGLRESLCSWGHGRKSGDACGEDLGVLAHHEGLVLKAVLFVFG